MKRSFIRLGIGIAFMGGTLTACDDSAGVGTETNLSILLTDAPSDFIGQAMVDIGAIELLGGAGGPIVLTDDGTNGFVNLLDLRDAATLALASTQIEAGAYTQLRLAVEEARVTLAGNLEFVDGGNSMALTVPSGAQTGIKLNLAAGDAEGTEGSVEIVPGEMVLVVDFDVNQSFVIQGNPETPAGISGVSFQPTLRVVVHDVAGSMSGSVTTQVPGFSVQGRVVTATPVGGTTLEPFQTMSATGVTGETGDYTVLFLVPGDYEVSVDTGEGYTSTSVTVSVAAGASVTGVDFNVIEG
ncbi:MAG: DUF4382 domain-containing protein [Gemmatimonadota bacterium]|nr:DUF4382 domain-containing protein [Gemmatimonadota bacterium]